MLRVRTRGVRLCDGLDRRELLHVGGLGLLGLTLPDLLAAATGGANGGLGGIRKANAAPATGDDVRIVPSGGRAKSCILLFMLGGQPQHSTWDPKPDAPAEVRGEIGPIATNVAGLQFGELMPRLAGMADRLCVLRGVSTNDNAHSSSGYYMLTGRPHVPMNRENANPGAPNDWPCLGAVVQRLEKRSTELPPAVRLPRHIYNTDGSVWPGQTAGFLGARAEPWYFRCEPASPDYRIPEFTLPVDVTSDRLLGRAALLREYNQRIDAAQASGALGQYDRLTQRAFNLLSSAESRSAFNLELEKPAVRERYGASQFGQSCLLARRLVETGVRLVQVNWFRGPDEPTDSPCWDSHSKETDRLKKTLVPPMDQGFSALLDDLAERGMLDETLVVCLGEFGRTPKFNGRAGRDHWGPVFSVAMAGGGVRGGMAYGASDRQGAYPREGLVRPEDLAATIFHCLGYGAESEFHDAQGRPLTISRGTVIRPILA